MATQPPAAEGMPLTADAAPLPSSDAGTPPVAETAAAEPVVETAPVAEPAASSEVPAAEQAAEPAAEPVAEAGETGDTPPAEEKPAEAAEEKPAEPGAFPTYEAFKVPEGVTIEGEDLSALTNILGKHTLSQDAAQELIDFGTARIKTGIEQAQKQMEQRQQDVWNDTQSDWRKQCEKQFGNRFNTTVEDAKSAIRDAVPNEKARAELWNVLAFTGAGNHPAVIQAFAAIGKKARERGAPGPSINTTITANPADRRYGPR